MGSRHSHPHRRPPRWGEPRAGLPQRLVERIRGALGADPPTRRDGLPVLPLALRHGEVAELYLGAERSGDHRRAGAVAMSAAERAIAAGDWWPADAWSHRALWHFEQAQMALAATRAARRIGDLRVLAGDLASARRYYAEAISEARDIGAEREEGLSALGLGRAELEIGNVTVARRLGRIATDLLERCGAPTGEVAAAHELRGTEIQVGGVGDEEA